MHELSLAGGILRMVEQARERDPFERVTQLSLEVGALSGVDADALRFALEAIAPDTCLAGAIERIENPRCLGRLGRRAQAVRLRGHTARRQAPLRLQALWRVCTPESPMGSCMVSNEGACAAHYSYGRFRNVVVG